MCGAGSFFWFLFFMFTALQYCTMYGFLAVALTPDLMTAAVLSSAFYGIWNLTAGFIMPQPVRLHAPHKADSSLHSTLHHG